MKAKLAATGCLGVLCVFALRATGQDTAVFPSFRVQTDSELNPDPDSEFWKGVRV